jgi:hypothetical protein
MRLRAGVTLEVALHHVLDGGDDLVHRVGRLSAIQYVWPARLLGRLCEQQALADVVDVRHRPRFSPLPTSGTLPVRIMVKKSVWRARLVRPVEPGRADDHRLEILWRRSPRARPSSSLRP